MLDICILRHTSFYSFCDIQQQQVKNEPPFNLIYAIISARITQMHMFPSLPQHLHNKKANNMAVDYFSVANVYNKYARVCVTICILRLGIRRYSNSGNEQHPDPVEASRPTVRKLRPQRGQSFGRALFVRSVFFWNFRTFFSDNGFGGLTKNMRKGVVFCGNFHDPI